MKKTKKVSKKENLILYFNTIEEPTGQDGGFVFMNAELFSHSNAIDFEIISVAIDVNLYLDLLLYKKELNTFTDIYFSYNFIGNYEKSIGKQLYVYSGCLNGMSKEGKFKLIGKI